MQRFKKSQLSGMPGLSAVASWGKVAPRAALMDASASVPSEPVPDKMTPIALVGRSWASDWKKEEGGDGMMSPNSISTCSHMQRPLFDGELGIRRDDIGVVRKNGGIVHGIGNRESAMAGQQGGELDVMMGVKMLDDHESHADICRQIIEEQRQRLQTSSRCPQAGHGKSNGAAETSSVG